VAASGILSPEGLARAAEDLSRPADGPGAGEDEPVGALVRRRLGDEVLDRLVAPLVGGIWAGECDRLSLLTAVPQLAAARDRPGEPSLLRSAALARAAALEAARAAGDRPVFLAPEGGMGRLVDTLADRLGDAVAPGRTAVAVTPEGGRWRIATTTGDAGGPGRSGESGGLGPGAGGPGAGAAGTGASGVAGRRGEDVLAGAVVVAVPAFAAAPLVAPLAPAAGASLAGIDHASVVLVAVEAPRAAVDRELDGSGFLVPASAGRLLTACSWVSTKWAHHAGDGSTVLLRASAGRAGDGRALAMPDEALVPALLADLADTMALHGTPTAVRVTRWPRSFPQPAAGHLDRVAAAEADLAAHAPRVALAGAWMRGVGIPACIRGGRAAAAAVLGAGGRVGPTRVAGGAPRA
jgi:oxygen-dependent protoporphyrinogen oxidase